MKKLISTLVITTIALVSALPVMAQQKRLSPHETISAVIDGNRVTITYGRPYTKNPRTGEVRKIWGGLVPYGKVWRTGADEATLLITQKPMMIGATDNSGGRLHAVHAAAGGRHGQIAHQQANRAVGRRAGVI